MAIRRDEGDATDQSATVVVKDAGARCCGVATQLKASTIWSPMKDAQALLEIRSAVLGCLEGLPGVVNVRSESDVGPSSPGELSAWERQHGTLLPDDLKEFYMLWDGMEVRWDVIAHGREVVPLGCLAINALAQLAPLKASTLLNERDEPRPELPTAAAGGLKPFDLDVTSECGRLILLLGCAGAPRRAEVWFMDSGCGLTRIAPSFIEYFRLLAVSLGLPRWPYAHTEAGLDPTSRQWFRLLAPHHLAIEEDERAATSAVGALSLTDAAAPPANVLVAASPPHRSSSSSSSLSAAKGSGVGGGLPPSHRTAMALLQRAGGASVQAAGPPIAAGAPREAVALLNGGGPVHASRPGSAGGCACSRSSETSSSDGSHPPRGAARPTGGRHRTLRAAGKAAGMGSKRASLLHEPPADE